MSLLSFRAPVLYAACYRCGNPLTHGEDECPHCGTNQSRALRTVGGPNSADYGSNVVLMPGRMLVPYPSVPEEIDTAMNIARERKRVLKQVAFYLASAGMLAMALGLAYAPALRSPVVQRLAALPEPAARKAVIVPPVPLAAEDNAGIAVAASAATAREMTPVSQAVVSAAASAPPARVAQAVPQPHPQPQPANVARVNPPVVAPSVVAAASPETASIPDKAAELISSASSSASSMAISALATIEAQAHAFNSQVSNTYDSLFAMASAAIHSTTADTLPKSVAQGEAAASAPSLDQAALSSRPATTAATSPTTAQTGFATVAQAPAITPSVVAAVPPTPVVSTAAAAAPAPTATADVPIASHAPQPSALTENGLPSMSMAPISPAMTAQRPPAGSPGETLYIARLALLTNDLSAARKNLAEVPSSLADDVEARHIRDELAQREAARDTAMQHARACDAASSWRCARRYAKDATAIDTSYPDSRILLKRVNFKLAQAKKAADAAALQANNAAHPMIHAAPIREAVVVSSLPRAMPPGAAQQSVHSAAASPSSGNSTPHLFAAPPVRATREWRENHESHVNREVREIASAPATAKSPETQESESRVYGGGVPIRPPGRGEAH